MAGKIPTHPGFLQQQSSLDSSGDRRNRKTVVNATLNPILSWFTPVPNATTVSTEAIFPETQALSLAVDSE